jgi:enterochelin esterase-like enzyme
MGGNHTLHVAIPRLDKFAYVGVYSSGLFLAPFMGGRGGAPAPPAPGGPPPGPTVEEWETANAKVLGNPAIKKGLKLFWFGTGKDDFLLNTTRQTVEMFKKHNFNVVYDETAGAHTWLVWRAYLQDFVPKLFQ